MAKLKKHISRREFLRIVAVGGAAGLAVKAGIDFQSHQRTVSETRLLMGTIVNLTMVSDDPAQARTALRACLDRMKSLEGILSRFIPESQLSQLNQAGFLGSAHPALVEVIAASQKISQLSGGAFDITVKPLLEAQQAGRTPTAAERAAIGYQNLKQHGQQITFLKPRMGLTLDGIAKGYIVDRGVDLLCAYGLSNILVESGGDLVAHGKRADGQAWKLSVADPRPTADSGYLTSFSITDCAAATSGDYLQHYTDDKSQHHIIHPQTGFSPPELASVTVLAPNAMQADALSTTLMVLGIENGLKLVDQMPGVAALLVNKDKQIYASKNFPG